MKSKLKKRILLVIKLVVATALLLWVFSQAHWSDYVVDRDGESWVWLDEEVDGQPMVAEGRFDALLDGRWHQQRRVFEPERFVPVAGTDGQYVRKGIASTLATANKWLLVVAVVVFPINLAIVGARLWFLLRLQGIYLRLWEMIRLTFLGQFFNMVVPGTVGGDVVKAWYICKHTPRAPAVLVSIFVDRLMGLVELVLMAGVMLSLVLLTGRESVDRMESSIVTVLVVLGIVTVAVAFLLSRRLRQAMHLQRFYQKLPIAHHIDAAGKAVRIYRRRMGALLQAVLVTFGAHVLFVTSFALMGMALHIDVPFYLYYVYIPLIYIIGAVPITPGGLGLVEKLYVTFFVTAAASGSTTTATQVVTLAMLARLLPVFWGLPGLLVAITGPKLPKAEEMEAELAAAEARQSES
jgi:hypothetical protein